ncbi:MAG: DUF4198 domain-containing protein [Persephonella sp.]|nr:DUF4198 domain-containing protein [Persephonella sp.]
MRGWILLLLSIFSFSTAHQLWIEKGADGFVLYYGHKNPSEGEKKVLNYSSKNIKKVVCVRNNTFHRLNIHFSYPLIVKDDCDAIKIDFSTGYWTKTVNGTVNEDKSSISSPLFSWYSLESVTYLNRWDKDSLRSLDGFIILPVKNPLKIPVGEKLRLRVLYNGRPLSDVPVAYDGKVLGLTDRDGRINIRVRHKGLQHIEATYRKKVNTEKADYIIYTTTLNFEVK